MEAAAALGVAATAAAARLGNRFGAEPNMVGQLLDVYV